ncbi:MAG: archaellin/type IV pilin N-terminal domain-containing protein [Candidatus Aenigmatarchaeota archaeon]
MHSRKGVSPIISAVLLIAVAVSVGILVTTWVTSWVTTQTGSNDISCAIDTNYVIDSAQFKNTSAENTLLVRITNKGKQSLYGFGMILDNGTNVLQVNETTNMSAHFTYVSLNPTITQSNPLSREASMYISINLSNSTLGNTVFGGSLTSVRVTNKACDAISAAIASVTQVS